jgi:superfamily II DNA or RNA helicase
MKSGHVKLRILNESTLIVVGLQDKHFEYFYEQYGVFAPNYFFNPKFKLGSWDGKIRHFSKKGNTYLYLIDDLLPRIVGLGYQVEIDDLRSSNIVHPEHIQSNILSHILHSDTGEPIVLRDDQVEGINKLIESGYGICVAGTGSGKTIACVALTKAYGDLGIKSLIIVPDQSLIAQTKAEYIHCGLDTGEYSGLHKTLDHQHVVSTWQALQNNPNVVKLFNMVIVDECHGLKGPVLKTILTEHAGGIPYRFGFTGTLPKEKADQMAVHIAVGPTRFEMPARTLIEKGVLATLQIDILQLQEDLREEWIKFCKKEAIGKPPTYNQFKDQYYPDYTAEKAYLHRNKKRIEWIADMIEVKRDMKKGNVLCLVDNIAFGRRLAAQIANAKFVNGKDIKTAEERKKVYDLFKDENNLVVIATVHIAGTGLNIRRIFNLITIDIGKSFIRVVQAIGRGLRKADDKDHVTYTDVCSDLKYGKRHCQQRVNFYKEQQYPHKKHRINYTDRSQAVDV